MMCAKRNSQLNRYMFLLIRDGEGQIQIQSRQPGSRLKTPGLPIWVRYQWMSFCSQILTCIALKNRWQALWVISASFSTRIANCWETIMRRNDLVWEKNCGFIVEDKISLILFFPLLRTSSLHLHRVFRFDGIKCLISIGCIRLTTLTFSDRWQPRTRRRGERWRWQHTAKAKQQGRSEGRWHRSPPSDAYWKAHSHQVGRKQNHLYWRNWTRKVEPLKCWSLARNVTVSRKVQNDASNSVTPNCKLKDNIWPKPKEN